MCIWIFTSQKTLNCLDSETRVGIDLRSQNWLGGRAAHLLCSYPLHTLPPSGNCGQPSRQLSPINQCHFSTHLYTFLNLQMSTFVENNKRLMFVKIIYKHQKTCNICLELLYFHLRLVHMTKKDNRREKGKNEGQKHWGSEPRGDKMRGNQRETLLSSHSFIFWKTCLITHQQIGDVEEDGSPGQ